jgi:predicted  nucleic acid-binding Zn-ribbon protein
MSSDDPTTKLPDEAKYDTKPGISAVLERINALGQELRGEFSGIDTRLDKIESDVAGLRAEMQSGFKKLDRRLDVLNGEIIDIKDNQRKLEDHVDKLEEKVS